MLRLLLHNPDTRQILTVLAMLLVLLVALGGWLLAPESAVWPVVVMVVNAVVAWRAWPVVWKTWKGG